MHKIAFHIGSFPVHSFGLLVACGFIAGAWTAGRRAPRVGVGPQTVYDLTLWLMLGGILGARLLYVITFWRQEFAGQPFGEIFKIWRGGLVFYGGFAGATLAGILYARFQKLPVWRLADVMAPSVALGAALGRLGCLMNGCCFGRACDLPWAIHFPHADHNPHATRGIAVHPVQVYDALLNFALYGALAWLFRRRRFDGQVFAAYVLAYPFTRSLAEFFRGDYPPEQRLGWLTPAQTTSVVTLVFGVGLWWWLSRRARLAAGGAAGAR